MSTKTRGRKRKQVDIEEENDYDYWEKRLMKEKRHKWILSHRAWIWYWERKQERRVSEGFILISEDFIARKYTPENMNLIQDIHRRGFILYIDSPGDLFIYFAYVIKESRKKGVLTRMMTEFINKFKGRRVTLEALPGTKNLWQNKFQFAITKEKRHEISKLHLFYRDL